MRYRALETTYSLLISYEVLALQHKRTNKPGTIISMDWESGDSEEVPSMQYNNFGFTFALLNINAAIVEGIMRSILSEIVYTDMNKGIHSGIKTPPTKRSSADNLLNKFYLEIDTQGGWKQLKKQYTNYLDLDIDRNIKTQTKEAIEALFLLRNILAHGTTLIHPTEQVPDETKGERLFKWQNRLQATRVYLKNEFSNDDIFDNLADYNVPEHFLRKTQDFLTEILPSISHVPQSANKTINAVLKYEFGYRIYSY